jgi:hypothetical protein
MLVLDPTEGVAFIDLDQVAEGVRDTSRRKPKRPVSERNV